MRRLGIVLLMALAVITQVSLLPGLHPFGVVPNVALVMMVLVALNAPTSEALVAAAVCGLILDVASGANFGLWTGVFMLSVLVVGLLHRAGIELQGPLVAMGLVAAGTIVIAVVIVVALSQAVGALPGVNVLGRFLIELVINLGLTLALAPPVRWMLSGGRRAWDSGA